MTSAASEILDRVLEFYLESGDFNGLPVARIKGEIGATVAAVERLVSERMVDVITERIDMNAHIKRFPVPEPAVQIEALRGATEYFHVCVYPHPDVLAERIDRAEYAARPYSLELALGSHHLADRAFNLAVLERYRNDPRYHYSCDDVHGWISISDEYYKTDKIAERDQILLEHFGFAYNEKFDRAVAVFVTDLAGLSPEHQQIWRAEQLGGEFKMHPDFIRSQIFGEFPEHIPVFTAFWMELGVINEMTAAMGRPALFRDITVAPRQLSFLVRPTLNEFNDFVLALDKVLSDNLNKDFFGKEVALEAERVRKDGKIEVRQKGTLQLLEEWARAKFRTTDWTPLEEAMTTFRKIRQLRQSPAHRVQADAFDQKYFHEQRELVIAAYSAVRTLRLMFANHPAARRVRVVEELRDGKICTY